MDSRLFEPARENQIGLNYREVCKIVGNIIVFDWWREARTGLNYREFRRTEDSRNWDSTVCFFKKKTIWVKQAQYSLSFLGDSKAREERKGSTRRRERGTCCTISRENNIEGVLVEYCTWSIIGFLFHQTYDVNNKIACLQPVWISKASSLQRRGRAGR